MIVIIELQLFIQDVDGILLMSYIYLGIKEQIENYPQNYIGR